MKKVVCLHMRKQRSSNPEADQCLCFGNTVRTIHLLLKFGISSPFPSSVAEQPVYVGPGRKPRRPVFS